MDNNVAVQELNWPLLAAYIDKPFYELPEDLRARAASVSPAPWDALSPGQRESLIKASDCPIDPEAEIEFAAAFHGFDVLAKMRRISATKAAEALLTENAPLASFYDVDSLASVASALSTDEKPNAGKEVLHPLAEWLRRAKAEGITGYLPSLDWAVERWSVPPASTEPPATVAALASVNSVNEMSDITGLVAWQAAVLESWAVISEKYKSKQTARNVMSWCKKDGPRDVFGCEQPTARESMKWIDSSNKDVHTVTLARIGTVISEWRKAGKIPAKE